MKRMHRFRHRRKAAVFGFALGAVAACFGTSSFTPQAAHAQAANPTPDSPIACVVSGDSLPQKDLEIFDKPSGGVAIAKLTGSSIALSLSQLPADPVTTRAHVITGRDGSGFRVDGYVDSRAIPLVTKSEVATHPGHVWIGRAQEVLFVRAEKSGIRLRKALSAPVRRTFDAVAACDALTLTRGTPPGSDVPDNARGYIARADGVTLLDAPSNDASEVVSLSPSGDGILFWSTRAQGAFVNVIYSGEIVIDAWARRSELEPLPRGELMDRLLPPSSVRSVPALKLAKEPKLVTTTERLELRTQASDQAAVIGSIEPGTETYVLDIVVGWASVLPKVLNLTGTEQRQLWVKASALKL
jgi:hypothetical protein